MEINKIKFAAEIAKSRTSDKRWLAAIDRAVKESSTWVVTEHVGFTLITTDGGTYRVSGHHCNCKAGALGQPCKHASYVRLAEIAESDISDKPTVAGATSSRYCGDKSLQHLAHCKPHIERTVERDVVTRRRVKVTRCDNWII